MRRTSLRKCAQCALFLALGLFGCATPALAVPYSFTWLGTLNGDDTVIPYAISDNGLTVVGGSTNSSTGVSRAFRWTAATGLTALGDLPGGKQLSYATGVSADGSVIAGSSSSALSFSHNPGYREPFRWDQGSGMTGLGYLPGTNGSSGDGGPVSGNGLVIGGSSSGDGGAKPFLWSAATGMVDIDTLGHGQGGQDIVYGLNYDGSKAVGMTTYDSHRRGFFWSSAGGMQLIGSIPGTDPSRVDSWPQDLSGDGSVVVGYAYTTTSIVPFRWTPAGGMASLPLLPGTTIGGAYGVSSNGSIAVGHIIVSSQDQAVRWDPLLGPQSIEALLRANGFASQLSGTQLARTVGISADGQTMTGYGSGPQGLQAWVATIPVAVPEPSTFVLALCGGVAILGYARRRGMLR